jgi:hypothetical protein
MLVHEGDTLSVNGNGGKEGDVYLVAMKLIRLRNGRRVLHPEGRLTARGLRITAHKSDRKRKTPA